MLALRKRCRHLSLLALAVLILAGCSSSQPAPAASSKPAETPKPVTEAAKPASNAPLTIVDSLVLGSANLTKEELSTKVCVLASQFLHNQEPVWRIKVIDPATGKPMDDSTLAKVTVKLPDGQTFDAKYGAHPHDKPTDNFWAAAWEIPENYPNGAINYTITAEAKDGRKGSYVSFNVSLSLLTVMDGKVPKLAKS